jgi:hypothetical protein
MDSMLKTFGHKLLSRKLIVWVTATALLVTNHISTNDWLILTGIYVGAQGMTDFINARKTNV